MSLGNVARSSKSTFAPRRASSIANGEPAHRAPTSRASYIPGHPSFVDQRGNDKSMQKMPLLRLCIKNLSPTIGLQPPDDLVWRFNMRSGGRRREESWYKLHFESRLRRLF